MEVEWEIGPVPVEDGVGKEVVARFQVKHKDKSVCMHHLMSYTITRLSRTDGTAPRLSRFNDCIKSSSIYQQHNYT